MYRWHSKVRLSPASSSCIGWCSRLLDNLQCWPRSTNLKETLSDAEISFQLISVESWCWTDWFRLKYFHHSSPTEEKYVITMCDYLAFKVFSLSKDVNPAWILEWCLFFLKDTKSVFLYSSKCISTKDRTTRIKKEGFFSEFFPHESAFSVQLLKAKEL